MDLRGHLRLPVLPHLRSARTRCAPPLIEPKLTE
jgi:hypothetical protein